MNRLAFCCYVLFFGYYINAFTGSQGCEKAMEYWYVLTGSNLKFKTRVQDITNYGIKIVHFTPEGRQLFVDINKPGTAHFPVQENYIRTNISVDADLSEVMVQISGLRRSDGGTFVISGRHLLTHTFCHVVYILGKPTVHLHPQPASQIWTESGSNVVLECTAETTTYPPDHGLPMHTKWSKDGIEVANKDKMYILQNLTEHDNESMVSCEVTEERGNESVVDNFVLLIHWGPKNIKFEPTKEYYKVQLGTKLPLIKGTAACNPPCQYKWVKDGHEISQNGLLSLGTVNRETEGTFKFYASRTDTLAERTEPLTVVIDTTTEEPGSTIIVWTVSCICIIAGLAVAVAISYRMWKWLKSWRHGEPARDIKLNESASRLIRKDGAASGSPSKEYIKNKTTEHETQKLKETENGEPVCCCKTRDQYGVVACIMIVKHMMTLVKKNPKVIDTLLLMLLPTTVFYKGFLVVGKVGHPAWIFLHTRQGNPWFYPWKEGPWCSDLGTEYSYVFDQH